MPENLSVLLHNSAGLKWAFELQTGGYALGGLSLRDQLLETPLQAGMLCLRNIHTSEQRWLPAQTALQKGPCEASFSGKANVDESEFTFEVSVKLDDNLPAACLTFTWQVDQDIQGWEVCLAYQDAFSNPWIAHFYPFCEDAKFIAQNPLTYMGVPAVMLYRDDLSMGLLFGIDPAADYLNPTTWTGQIGLFFMDQVIPPQFRVGGGKLSSGIEYSFPLQLVLSDAGEPTCLVTDLVENWVSLNKFDVEPFFVRTPQQALDLFLEGRRSTSSWNPGVGYRLEEGDPHSNFVYLGEQPLSAYFEYRIYLLTGESIWRQRCLEQIDFILKAQETNPTHMHYGAFHTAYDLWKQAFDSDDRGRNVGYKPDLNAYMARYILMTWKLVKEQEGIEHQDWYRAAVLATDWVLRQRNPDGGLPQKVDIKTGSKSISVVSGRALPAMPVIAELTGDKRYQAFAVSLEAYLVECVEAHFRFTGHHPDLPPDEIEEASVWGAIEYWLGKFDHDKNPNTLQHAVADAYLAFLWWCPKQLSWVHNPTLFGSAEQQHFLQYSIYCYQNRKIQCLHRLADATSNSFFSKLYERLLQGVFWTQVTAGDQRGATHERIADPWLERGDYGEPADFNSLGSIYMGEQSLDTMLQLIEIYQ
jgi:hypothetical protein